VSGGTWFIAGIALMEVCAAVAYAWRGSYPDAVIWTGAAIANTAWVWKVWV
jgi:hypothetical protein